MLPITGEAAEEWPQYGDPGEAENDRNIRNPNSIGADFVGAEDDEPAPEVGIAAVVAEIHRPIAHAVPDNLINGAEVDDPFEYEEGFIPLGDVNLPDVHHKSSALYMPPPVIEDSPESPWN